MPPGRKPFEWTQEIQDQLFDGIIEGQPICQILETIGVSQPTFYRKRLNDEGFDRTIVRAQEMAQEANVDRTELMAQRATVENWQLVQFQCRNVQWVAGKRKPKKYGDKIMQEHTGADGTALVFSLKRVGKDEA